MHYSSVDSVEADYIPPASSAAAAPAGETNRSLRFRVAATVATVTGLMLAISFVGNVGLKLESMLQVGARVATK
jgi:hypothetical protein